MLIRCVPFISIVINQYTCYETIQCMQMHVQFASKHVHILILPLPLIMGLPMDLALVLVLASASTLPAAYFHFNYIIFFIPRNDVVAATVVVILCTA